MRAFLILLIVMTATTSYAQDSRSSRKRGNKTETAFIDNCRYLDERTKYFVETLMPQADTVKLAQFLATGINLNQCANDYESILCKAIPLNKPELIGFLVRAGADPNMRIRHTQTQIFSGAVSYRYSGYPLEAAARLPNTATFEVLLHNGAKLDLCEKQVREVATQTSNIALLGFLEKETGVSGVAPNTLATMLEFSYERTFDQVTPAFIHEMVKKGADVNAYSANGNTPLQSVMRNKAIKDKTAILKALLQHNADPNKKENRTSQGAMKYYPKSATMIAVEANNLEWVRLFFENGAKPEKDMIKWAPNDQLREFLILKGAN